MKSWQNWAIFVGGMAVFLFGTGNFWSATWLSKWALILALFGVAISFWAALRTSLAYLPLMLYGFLSLITMSVWPEQPYKDLFDPVTTLALQKNALYGLVVWTICVTAFASVKKKYSECILVLLSTIWASGTLGILSLPLQGTHNAVNNGMWFGNPSMGAGLLACLMPFAWALANVYVKNRRQVFFLISLSLAMTLLAIYKTRASIPWGVFGAVSFAVIVARGSVKGTSWKWTPLSFASIAVLLLITGTKLIGKDFLFDSGRFEVWQMAWAYFREHGNPAFGMGFATSQVLIPVEQVMTSHYNGSYWLWLHNDWLQLVIEGGYVGTACALLAVARLLTVSFKKPALFGSLVGFCVLAVFNYPLRMPIHCMCLVMICGVTEAYATKKSILLSQNEVRSRRRAAERNHLMPPVTTARAKSDSYNQCPEPSKS